MPQRRWVGPGLAMIFHALADPTRLAVVQRLGVAPASATELAKPFAVALPSFMHHLSVLERAAIVSSTKSGRTRTFRLVPGALQLASAWMDEFCDRDRDRVSSTTVDLDNPGRRSLGRLDPLRP
jgi:DNA-binding transcriptional ArsR family regulator